MDNTLDRLFIRFSIHNIFLYFQKQNTSDVQDYFLNSNFIFTNQINYSIHLVPYIQEGKSGSTTFRVFRQRRFHLVRLFIKEYGSKWQENFSYGKIWSLENKPIESSSFIQLYNFCTLSYYFWGHSAKGQISLVI